MRFSEELERALREVRSDIAQLQARTDEQPVRHPKPIVAEGSGQYGVVRTWDEDDRPIVNMTILLLKSKTGAISGISRSPQAVVTVATGHGILAADSVSFSGVAGMTEINGQQGTVQSVAENTITVDINSSAFTAYTGSGIWTLPAIRQFLLETDTTTKIATDGGIPASAYEAFKYVGSDEDVYPLLLPTGVVPLPILIMGGVRTVWHHSKIYYGSVPLGMPQTEGIIVNGQGELGFAN